MSDYIETADVAAAARLCTDLGKAYALKAGRPWPMPPDSYGPGKQPVDKAAYYQRYYVAPLEHLVPAEAATVALLDKASVGDGGKVDLSARKDEALLSDAGKAVLAQIRDSAPASKATVPA